MAFPMSFAQNPEFYWEPEVRRRRTDYFPVFVALLAVLLLGVAVVAPRFGAAGDFEVLGP